VLEQVTKNVAQEAKSATGVERLPKAPTDFVDLNLRGQQPQHLLDNGLHHEQMWRDSLVPRGPNRSRRQGPHSLQARQVTPSLGECDASLSEQQRAGLSSLFEPWQRPLSVRMNYQYDH
jgi:hypothetical protein